MFVGSNPVSWRTKKQHVIACSSAEVEYHAMASVAYELIWPKGLMSDLGFSSSIPMILFCNNQVLYILQLILCFMKELNTLEFIVILFVNKFSNRL